MSLHEEEKAEIKAMEEDSMVISNSNKNNDDDDDNDNETSLIDQFLSFTGTTDEEVARQYLEMSENGLEDAVNLFWVAATTNNDINNTEYDSNDVDAAAAVDGGGRNENKNIDDNGELLLPMMAMDGRVAEANETSQLLVSTSSSSEGAGTSNNADTGEERVLFNKENEEGSEHPSVEPDYDYLIADADVEVDYAVEEKRVDVRSDDNDDTSLGPLESSPNYEYLNLDSVYEDEMKEIEHPQAVITTELNHERVGDTNATNNDPNGIYPTKGHKVDIQPMSMDVDDIEEEEEEEEEVEDMGEEYILGTMMVRVLQARHVKSNPYNEGGGLIANLLSNHRRNRHQRTTPSPASAGGGYGTPSTTYSGNNQQIYATLSYRNQSQFTSMAMEHNGNGDYYWSRSDQSYFDVTCPAFPLKMNQTNHHPKSPSNVKQTCHLQKNASHEKSNIYQHQPRKPIIDSPSPLLELSLYSKKNSSQGMHNKQGKWNPYQKDGVEMFPGTNDDYLVGKCYINVLRVLSGKTPYFDEWCTIHNDDDNTKNNNNNHRSKNHDAPETMAGRVRIVIEYEPTDPPPRPGDLCVFANVYSFVDELFPIPPFSMIRTNTHRWSSSSSLASSSSFTKTVSCRPKTFCVEEVVGDHVVLSYQTPVENWKCTFEVHRYLLLCVERHQAAVEKYREQVLDLCDNLVQSPVVDVLTKTVSTLPDEGLVNVGTELVIGSLGLLGRWWENGLDGMIEDVVDGINLDGRHSHFSDDDEEVDDGVANEDTQDVQNPLMVAKNVINLTETVGNDERMALPGMPCCPITGVPMIEPVVAADGHTYERHAIARWLQTSSRSPLTGEVLAHRELVPNYLLLSSLGNEMKKTNDEEIIVPGLLDVL